MNYVYLIIISMHTAAARGEKRRRQLERQSLMSDGDSVGTAGSLGRASQGGDRRRWKKYGESSTLMVGGELYV